jgi:hypothetical protein
MNLYRVNRWKELGKENERRCYGIGHGSRNEMSEAIVGGCVYMHFGRLSWYVTTMHGLHGAGSFLCG